VPILSKARFFLTLIACASTALVVLCSLPHDKYLRYRDANIGAAGKPRWIYERVHFDTAPIDIAFLGTSHTLNGIDSEIVSDELTSRWGRPVQVCNLSLPYLGRDLQLSLAKELFRVRKPQALVIEVRENDARDGHPGVYQLADWAELVQAPLLVNLRYFSNLSRLPYRQTRLFLMTQLPQLFGVSNEYDAAQYRGTHLNVTREWAGVPRDSFLPQAELTELRRRFMIENGHKLVRDNPLKDFVYYNASWSNLCKIVDLAKGSGVKVLFVYLPDYGSQLRPINFAAINKLAPIIIPDLQQLYQKDVWFDLGHLNAAGAVEVSEQVAKQLSDLIGE